MNEALAYLKALWHGMQEGLAKNGQR